MIRAGQQLERRSTFFDSGGAEEEITIDIPVRYK